MSRHPVTPMAEADLRLHLAEQGLAPMALLDLRDHEHTPEELDARLQAMWTERPRAVLIDVVKDAHLATIGRLLWQRAQAAPQLCVGSSSVAQALLDHWGVARQLHPGTIAPTKGPVLVLSGSMSPTSARQIAAARSYERVALDALKLAQADAAYADISVARICALLRSGRHVLAHISQSIVHAGAGLEGAASRSLALACGRLLRRVLEAVVVSRLGVAGGDTSSLALQALSPTAMEWLGRPAAGIALCRIHAKPAWLDGMEVMLKGGQMGDDDVFERLIEPSAA